ncbi:uncharacterized protein LOC131030986 [Cryptomeria japonica]|uniref:uncharacterized protein LOC131030986 n=1 Tax=Cryptomeria japonica TaxID=3369 RepID=UPI0027DA7DCB|nr:uncharacterized protein LOC131030986 [Cryptomeria japonica]
MGLCLARPRNDCAPVFPNELHNEFHGGGFITRNLDEFHGGFSTKSLDEFAVLEESMDDCSSAKIKIGKDKLSSPEKFQFNSDNTAGQKSPKNRKKLKTRSKNSNSCSADLILDFTLDIDMPKKVSRSCSEKKILRHGSLNNCTEMNPISVDCENAKGETGEEDADFDEILFGHKTAEILDFFREHSSNTTADSPHSRPKLQIYSILDMKKLKSIRLSQFSKSSRFGSSNSETESPRSKLIGLLMKNLSSRSKSKCSADKNMGDMKSACECNDKSVRQKELVQEHKKHKPGRRPCLLSMFNVDRSFTVEGNTETLIFADHDKTTTGVLNNLMGGSRVDIRIPVKTLSNEFVMFNFCPNEGGADSTKLHETTASAVAGVNDVGFRSMHQLQGVCRLSRLSLTEEEAAFGSPFSIGRGRRSKGSEFPEDLILGRLSADAFSDSSSDLFELEFLGHQMGF